MRSFPKPLPRAGLKRKHRPIGVFLLLGPTGIGKTETAKVLSNYLFSHSDALIKLDMSEYGERFSISQKGAESRRNFEI